MENTLSIRRSELLRLQSNLDKLSEIRDVIFSYFLKRNLDRVSSLINQTRNWAFKQQQAMKGDMQGFHDKHNALIKLHAETDEKGDTIPDQFGGLKIKDVEAYQLDFDILKEGFKLEAENMDKFETKYQELLNEVINLPIYKIDFAKLPSDISLDDLYLIEPFIDNLPVDESVKLEEIPDLEF